jgi:hypothetical protein
MRSKFFAWLAEFSHRTKEYALRKAFKPIHEIEMRDAKYGCKAYSQLANQYYDEAMQHEPLSLCRREGLEQATRVSKLAEHYRKLESVSIVSEDSK